MKSLYFLAILIKIALLILSYFDYPKLLVLRAIHPWFYNIIPPTTYSHL